MGTLLGSTAVANAASATDATPQITAVHFSDIGPNMRIEVDGTGFGAPTIGLPYVGDVSNFEFRDTSRGGTWGSPGVGGLQYTSWTNTKIVVNGFVQYNCGPNCIVQAGDQVSVEVWGKDSNEPVTWSGTLEPSPAGQPVAGQPNPVIIGARFSNIGQNMRMVVSGAGFGAPTIGLPYAGNVSNFEFRDTSRGGIWGSPGVGGLKYASWTNSQIVVTGFQVYNCGANCIVRGGDQVSIEVWNSKSMESYTWTGTLTASSATVPPPAAPVKEGLSLSSASLAPGGGQVATVTIKAGSSVVLVVNYPNGGQKVLGPSLADASGRVAFSWTVPNNIRGNVHIDMISPVLTGQATFVVS